MNNTKHTPGPWQIGGWPQIVATDARETIVCNVTGASSNEQATADACLIASAPELLEALKTLESMPDERSIHDISNEELTAWEKARAAIAKATGEKP